MISSTEPSSLRVQGGSFPGNPARDRGVLPANGNGSTVSGLFQTGKTRPFDFSLKYRMNPSRALPCRARMTSPPKADRLPDGPGKITQNRQFPRENAQHATDTPASFGRAGLAI